MGRTLNKVRYFLQYYGVGGVAPMVIGRLIPPLRKAKWLFAWKESRLDRRFGVETGGEVPVDQLDIDDEAKQQAVEYCPTSGILLGVILDELGIDYSKYAFVDFGCGKGRALCLAAEFDFREVIGVELSESLHQAANRNIARMNQSRRRCGRLRCVHRDAQTFEPPKSPLVLYFYNPFGEEVMSAVLRRIQSISQQDGTDVLVIYLNPVHRQLLDASSFWKEHSLRFGRPPNRWAIYRSAPSAD